MIYFDNAATTRIKPENVIKAFEYYISEIGVSPGRGSYSMGVEASRMLYLSRMEVAHFFGLDEPNVVFTKNSTEAINLFFMGYLKKGDHVVISPYEHNAVLRPLHKLKEDGFIEYSVIDRNDLLINPDEIIDKYFKSNTKLFASTLASNLTGRIIYDSELVKKVKLKGVDFFLDSSQGAGKIKINMLSESIDYLAFTGHKDLNGLPGIGGLCSKEPLNFSPLIQGGTGIFGHEKTNPKVYPEGFEAGTINMPAVWALKAAIQYTEEKFETCNSKSGILTDYLIKELNSIPNVIVYDSEYRRVDTVGFNIQGYSSNEVVQILDKEGICVRGGIHCAILAHESLGTTKTGVVRVSLSSNNELKEIDYLIDVIKRIGN